jgi:hypothetical protein
VIAESQRTCSFFDQAFIPEIILAIYPLDSASSLAILGTRPSVQLLACYPWAFGRIAKSKSCDPI